MSQEDVDVVRRAYAAWNAGDLEAAMAAVHPEVEVVQDAQIPGAITAKGCRELQSWLEGFSDLWESFQIEAGDLRQVGERVLVLAHVSARGKASSVPVETEVAHILTLRNGLVLRWQSYADAAEALEAVGLAE